MIFGKENYLITKDEIENLKVYDLKGNYVKEIVDSKIETRAFTSSVYYDKERNISYIIITNHNAQSYNFTENKLYKKYYYKEAYPDIYGKKTIVYKNNNIINLIL